MATRVIFICDRCKKESENNNLRRFEVWTDYCSEDMYRRISYVCEDCAKELIKPFLEEG